MTKIKIDRGDWHLQSGGSHPLTIRVVGPGNLPPLKCGLEEVHGVYDANGKPIKGLQIAFWGPDEVEDDKEAE